MKRLLAMLACVGLCLGLSFGTTGCGKGKDKETPKVTPPTGKKETTVGKDMTFTLEVETPMITMKADDSKTADVTIKRGKDVTKDVELKLENDGKEKGVDASVSPAKLAAGDTKSKLTVKTSKTATPGTYKVSVTAHGADLSKAPSINVTVKVEAAKDDTPKTDKDLPKTDKDLPKTDKDLPKTDKDLPKTDKDLPKTDKDLPKTDKDLPKKDKDLPKTDKETPKTDKVEKDKGASVAPIQLDFARLEVLPVIQARSTRDVIFITRQS